MSLAQRLNIALRRVPIWLVYLVGALPPVWYLYLGATGGLGVEPIAALEHALGLLGLQMMVATLAVTPLRRLTGVSLLRFRRAMGLVTFYYISCHLLVWLVLDVQAPARIWADIVERPYITVGMAGFAAMIPLAVTSNDRAVRKLGPRRWARLHRLTYVAALAGAVHFLLLVRAWPLEPLLYLAAILGLLALRLGRRRGARA
ncbi:protein-methionine-sulfoxide reductase heme-binding subunit MsrQ [Rhodobacteraceae bacterium WD3A24]|nr:protein-methionine-sulfoxide reductase heme-binding subunit MsrQ [Rhodobacteraceae bacterium WD3A24]